MLIHDGPARESTVEVRERGRIPTLESDSTQISGADHVSTLMSPATRSSLGTPDGHVGSVTRNDWSFCMPSLETC
jgi:hypothetical protein